MEEIEKREGLKRKLGRTLQETIKLNIVCKYVKRKLRIFNENENREMTESIDETIKSTKTVNRNLAIGGKWTTYIEDTRDEKKYNGTEINNTITEYRVIVK